MLIISGGIRRDSGRFYQLHQIDQERILNGVVKRYYLVENHNDIIPTIYRAYEIAVSGEPGPVFVALKVNPEVENEPIGRRRRWQTRTRDQVILDFQGELGI